MTTAGWDDPSSFEIGTHADTLSALTPGGSDLCASFRGGRNRWPDITHNPPWLYLEIHIHAHTCVHTHTHTHTHTHALLFANMQQVFIVWESVPA